MLELGKLSLIVGVTRLDSPRVGPYSRPESVQNSSSSSQDESDSSVGLNAVPQDLGVMVQRCYMNGQANCRQLQKLQESVSSLARQVESILNKLTEGDRGRFNLKDAHLEVSE